MIIGTLASLQTGGRAMIRRFFLVVLLSVVAISASRTIPPAYSTIQKSCSQAHQAWVTDILQRMETIKPGMTRAELLKVFTTEGGLSTGLQRTFVSRDCPYFKVDVEFKAFGRPDRDPDGRVTLVEDNRDIIAKVSRPYLQFGVKD
jgi:hypothetical protein